MRYLMLIVLLSQLWSTEVAAEAVRIKVATPPYVEENFRNWNAQSNCKTLTSYQSKYANRATVDLMLLCRALAESKLVFELILDPYPNYARALGQVTLGESHVHAETVWGIEVDPNKLYISSHVIRQGEFAKGIYVKEGNKALDDIQSLEDLSKFRGVMVESWIVDWKTISGFKLADLVKANGLESIYKIINYGNADFTLLEFSKAQHKVSSLNNINLRPVKGVKIALNGFRCFVVSKQAPSSETIFHRLQEGLQILRNKHEIQRAYTESGFFDASVKDWKLLNAEPTNTRSLEPVQGEY